MILTLMICFHSPQIRWLESDQPSLPPGLWDLDSGAEDAEVLHLSPFTGAVKTHDAAAAAAQGRISQRSTMMRPEHHERTVHSAVVTVVTSDPQDSGSSLGFDWTKVEPGQRSGYMLWS